MSSEFEERGLCENDGSEPWLVCRVHCAERGSHQGVWVRSPGITGAVAGTVECADPVRIQIPCCVLPTFRVGRSYTDPGPPPSRTLCVCGCRVEPAPELARASYVCGSGGSIKDSIPVLTCTQAKSCVGYAGHLGCPQGGRRPCP